MKFYIEGNKVQEDSFNVAQLRRCDSFIVLILELASILRTKFSVGTDGLKMIGDLIASTRSVVRKKRKKGTPK